MKRFKPVIDIYFSLSCATFAGDILLMYYRHYWCEPIVWIHWGELILLWIIGISGLIYGIYKIIKVFKGE